MNGIACVFASDLAGLLFSRIRAGLQSCRKPCFFYCLLYLVMLCLLNSGYKPPAAMSCHLGASVNTSLHVVVTARSAVGPCEINKFQAYLVAEIPPKIDQITSRAIEARGPCDVFSTLCLLASDSFLGIGSFDTPNNIISQGNNTNVHVLKVITLAALIVFFSFDIESITAGRCSYLISCNSRVGSRMTVTCKSFENGRKR